MPPIGGASRSFVVTPTPSTLGGDTSLPNDQLKLNEPAADGFGGASYAALEAM